MPVMSPLPIADHLVLPAEDLSMRAVRSSGPGGQNVNKVASKVELRFDLSGTRVLSDEIKDRVRALFPNRLDALGKLYVVSQKTRDQHKNFEDARDKLRNIVLAALRRDPPRVATKPKASAKRRRVADKRHVAMKKASRGRIDD